MHPGVGGSISQSPTGPEFEREASMTPLKSTDYSAVAAAATTEETRCIWCVCRSFRRNSFEYTTTIFMTGSMFLKSWRPKSCYPIHLVIPNNWK